MECKKDKNLEKCNCSYTPCQRKGICCECVAYHRRSRQLPACFFNENSEKTYNRSYELFASLVQKKEI